MKIPHTIPKVILRAYSRKLNEEALKKSYEGRLLISEKPDWDKDLAPTLAKQCLNLVVDEFLFYNRLIEYFNELKLGDYESRKAKWEADMTEYLERKASYDRRLAAYEDRLSKFGDSGDDPTATLDDDDDDDDHHVKVDASGKPIEPTKVEDEFSEFEPIASILNHLNDDDRTELVEEVELDLIPFPLAVKIIPDEYYWERQARDRWQVFDINDHAKSWRRLYMEKHAWDALERFHPADDDLDKLKSDLELVALEVIRLRIQNLIPICFGTPEKEVVAKPFEGDNQFGKDPEFDVGYGDEFMFEDPEDLDTPIAESTLKLLNNPKKGNKNSPKSSLEDDYLKPAAKRNPELDRRKDGTHIDFSLVLPMFANLKELTMVYEMVETGLNWEDRFFKFTDKDCLTLAKALAETPSLEKFELLRSRVTDEQCKTLVREGLIKLPHLKYLNLNYNRIGDVGARAVARLLADENSRAIHTIHTVRLARNRIYNTGGKALAFALTKNRHLAVLDLRLNGFGDAAGCYFGHALVKNTTLMALFLGANKLTEETAYVFGKMLFHNKSLRELDLSSNNVEKKGGEFLALGMRNNKNILRLDVRLCNIGLDFEYDVGTHLRKNRNRISAITSIVDVDDYYPPDVESGLFDLEDIPLEEPEDDDEDEEEGDEDEAEDADSDNDVDDTDVVPDDVVGGGIALGEMNPEIAALLAAAGGVAAALKPTEPAPVLPVPAGPELEVVKGPQPIRTSNHAIQ